MPKQILKIDQFHGGLSTNSDPRDIADNELSAATDIMVDEIGKIRLLGGTTAPVGGENNYHADWANPTSSVIKPGYGLFQFSHDRIDGHTAGTGVETGADYLVFGNADTPDAIHVYSNEDGVWGDIDGGFTDNSDGDCKFVFYFVDGVLRICDAEFGNANVNKWYGYVYRKDTRHPNVITDGDGSVGTISTWKLDSQYPSAPATSAATLVEKSRSSFVVGDVSLDDALTFRIDGGAGQSVDKFALDNEAYDAAVAAQNYTLNICGTADADHVKLLSPFVQDSTMSSGVNSIWNEASTNYWANDSAYLLESTHLLTNHIVDSIGGEDKVLEIPRDKYYDEYDDSWSEGDPGTDASEDFDGAHDMNEYTHIKVSKNIVSQSTPNPAATITWDGATAPVIKFDIYVTAGHPVLDSTYGGMGVKVLHGDATQGGWFFNSAECSMNNISGCNKFAGLDDANAWNITPGEWSTISLPITDWTNTLPSGIAVYNPNLHANPTPDVSLWNSVGIVFTHQPIECTWGLAGTANPTKHIYIKNFRTETDSVTSDKALRFYYAWKYDGVFYSPLSQLGTSDWSYHAGTLEKRSFSMHVRNTGFDLNERIIGASVYFRQVGEEDEDSNLYKLAELDFQKGYRIVTGDFTEFVDGNWDTSQDVLSTGDIPMPAALPTIITYEMDSGHDNTETDFSVRFGTAVVANRIAYVGNVRYDGQTFGDKILKSDVNQFDNFPKTNAIEASIADGDEIIKLEEYADRLLEFKKTKMTLINISQEIEFLEDTFKHKGVSHPAATCKTDYGIAWVNKLGCYLYDGKSVNNLLEKGGRQIIKESEWATFTTYEPMIGYISKKRQLLIANDVTTTGDGTTFLYDMVTQSWVKGAAATIASESKTNFVTDWNGDLVYVHTTGTVLKWDDTSDTSTDLLFKTKDIDFGQPAQAKKIYKVMITHKSAGDGKVRLMGEVMSRTATSDQGAGELSNDFTFSNLTEDSGQATNWITEVFTPPVQDVDTHTLTLGNIYSIKLYLKPVSGQTVPAGFEVNDISIVYRLKPVK